MMDSKLGTRIDNSLCYCVLFSNYGDLGHAVFVAYRTMSVYFVLELRIFLMMESTNSV